MVEPHRQLAKALIAEGWTTRRLAEALATHAHGSGEPDRAAHESRLSRIISGAARPTRAQAVAIYAVLVGAPAPIAWDPTYCVEPGEAMPEPAKRAAPPERPGLAKARPNRTRAERRGAR